MSNGYGYSYETGSTARRYTNVKRTVKGITIHHWGSMGSSFDGIVNWFCNPSTTAQTSAHYVAQGADANGTINRRVACTVAPSLIAWHAGVWQANLDTIGIEGRPEARDEDYDVVAELVARLWVTYGIVPLYPHRHWVTTQCPGRYDVDRVKREATVKYATLTGKPTTTPPDTGDIMANITESQLEDAAGIGVHKQTLGRSKVTIGVVLERLISTETQVNYLEKNLSEFRAELPGIVQAAVTAALASVTVTAKGS